MVDEVSTLPPSKLPGWVPAKELNRPAAEKIDEITKPTTVTYAGFNAVIPIVYGEAISGGPILAGPKVDNNDNLIYGVALCYAGDNGIEGIMDARRGDTIQNFNNNDTISVGSGITVTRYNGTQTSPDPKLDAAIPGYTDTFNGVAYVVVEVNSSVNFSSFSELQFRIKGRKCEDPRNNNITYTDNPVLFMYDFVTSADFGMGVDMIGANAAADAADSQYGGLPRTQAGFSIQNSKDQSDILAYLALYAEVLWSYDGRDVSVIPDIKANTVHQIGADTIRDDSIDMSTAALEQVPTLVRVIFTDRYSNPIWTSKPAEAKVPEHTIAGAPKSPSTVDLPGVFNRIEAERRAQQRLNRLQTPGRVKWQMQAPGLQYQAGDVVALPNKDGLHNVKVRIMAQPEMIAPSLYQLSGEIYSDDHYPIYINDTNIPMGAILVLNDDNPPLGWTDYFNSNVGVIKSTNATGPANNSSIQFSQVNNKQTGYAGEHIGTFGGLSQNDTVYDYDGGFGYYYQFDGAPSQPAGGHTHQADLPSITGDNYIEQHQLKFAQKTNALAELESGLGFLNDGTVSLGIHMQNRANLHGYLAGGTSNAYKPSDDPVDVTTELAGSHGHPADYIPALHPGNNSAFLGGDSSGHIHHFNYYVDAKLRSIALNIIDITGVANMPTGAIILWDQATIPTGWNLCDGTNGTVDLSDRFIYLTNNGLGTEHDASNEFIAKTSGTYTGGAHSHETLVYVDLTAPTESSFGIVHIAEEGSHSHSFDYQSDPITRDPPCYQLRFIQFMGN